jgi:hypothetical protein
MENLLHRFVQQLSQYPTVFLVGDKEVSLAPELNTPEKRTAQVARACI